MENINEPIQQESVSESTGIFKEIAKALRIVGIRGETIMAVSQSQSAFKYGLIFMLLPNIVLFVLILLSRVSVGFAGLLVSLAQPFLIIGLSFLIARFLFRGKGTLGGYFRPAAYSFIFIALTPLIVLVYAPLPTFAGLLAILTLLLGLWNIIVLAKVLQYTQNIGIIKSLVSVLIALLILSWGLSVPDSSISNQSGQTNLPEQSILPTPDNQYQQFDNNFPSQSIAPTPTPQQYTAPTSESEAAKVLKRNVMMAPMTNHMMQQISNGIWSGNYYNPSIPY